MNQPNYVHTTKIHNTNAANEVLPFIFDKFGSKAIVDIGCGTGSWLSVAKEMGATVIGIDVNYIEKELLCIKESEFQLHDLTLPISFEKKYDLAICLEVVEHLPENAADTIIETLTNASDIILFSAAIPNQGGQNHINEQWPVYWQKIFEKKGFYPVDILRPIFWENPKVDCGNKQKRLIKTTKKKMEVFGLQESKNFISTVHPELLNIKCAQIERLDKIIEENIYNPKFMRSLKSLIKSIINER